MLKRSKRNIFIGFTVFVFMITIILIVNIHNNVQFMGKSVTTSKYGTTTNLKANNAFCMNKVELDFRSLFQAVSPIKDPFEDLSEAIEYIESKTPSETKPREVAKLADFFSFNSEVNLSTLDKFNMQITQYELYSNDSKLVAQLLHEMSTTKIVKVDEKHGGTQFKLKIRLDNDMFAIAKPMRFPRDQQAIPNHLQFAEFERHVAEIAAFHLDRILGFRRTMPACGRVLNMTSEIIAVAESNLTDTFFISPQPDNNHCLIGNCEQYCDINHPICGKKEMLETVLIAYLPFYFVKKSIDLDEEYHPWRRSYNDKRKAVWEHDPKYCDRIKKDSLYKTGRRLLDLMDLAVFDFLTGNRDRHTYGILDCFGDDTFIVHFDNGRSFGRPFYDEVLNLVPISQCCMIRSSTLKTLLRFQNGPKPLSQLMRESMASDPIAPVLWEPHLEALDRRVNKILITLRECIELNTIEDVIYTRDNFGMQSSNSTQAFKQM